MPGIGSLRSASSGKGNVDTRTSLELVVYIEMLKSGNLE